MSGTRISVLVRFQELNLLSGIAISYTDGTGV